MMIKALRGRVVAKLKSEGGYNRPSGIYIPKSKDIPLKAEVMSVGDTSMTRNGEIKYSETAIGDIIHFKKYRPMFYNDAKSGMISVWWDDILMVETK